MKSSECNPTFSWQQASGVRASVEACVSDNYQYFDFYNRVLPKKINNRYTFIQIEMDDEERGEMRGKHQKFSILRHDWHNYLSAASCIYVIYI